MCGPVLLTELHETVRDDDVVEVVFHTSTLLPVHVWRYITRSGGACMKGVSHVRFVHEIRNSNLEFEFMHKIGATGRA
jgi:hypothetical protein